MKVILKCNVPGLGKAGDVVKTSEGYARNYLIPKDMALEATEKNLTALSTEKKQVEQKKEKERSKAGALRDQLTGTVCRISRQVGEQHKLFGSVHTKDIEKALKDMGIDVNRKAILLEEPIKALGEFPVKIKLPAGLTADITVHVVPDTP